MQQLLGAADLLGVAVGVGRGGGAFPHVRIGAAESVAGGLEEPGALGERFPGVRIADAETEPREVQGPQTTLDDRSPCGRGHQHLCDVAGIAEQPDGAHRVALHQLLDVVRDVRGGVQDVVGLVEDVVDLLAEARAVTAVVITPVRVAVVIVAAAVPGIVAMRAGDDLRGLVIVARVAAVRRIMRSTVVTAAAASTETPTHAEPSPIPHRPGGPSPVNSSLTAANAPPLR
ncbi:hypothetical protein EUA03_16785 [Mycolicibacterium mucogenicum]|uniref:Uncharacterized protein n=1 Tax=Mycolicibacterium mucogenicum TaxID=56689 RepID=A0A4R5WDX2_MYCMU|nr:hypothetical protein EUA03_16785 [Mycolicibacterium mucogenicum]